MSLNAPGEAEARAASFRRAADLAEFGSTPRRYRRVIPDFPVSQIATQGAHVVRAGQSVTVNFKMA